MTLDETIKEYMGMSEAAERFVDKYSNRDAFVGSVIKDMRQRISRYRQLAEWLTELKEAKRLLKLAVEDFAVYGALKDLSAEQRVQNPDWRRFNRVFDVLDHQWRYADEALKLIQNS